MPSSRGCALYPRFNKGVHMTTDNLVLSFSGATIICVIFAGLSARVALTDSHEFDALMGFSPVAAECSELGAFEAKPLAPLAIRH
jgi:hypothetical protein